MIWFGLILMFGVVMFMAMRLGADSPTPILAAIRAKNNR